MVPLTLKRHAIQSLIIKKLYMENSITLPALSFNQTAITQSFLKSRKHLIVSQLDTYYYFATLLDVHEEEALLKYLNRLPGPPSLQELMPELVRREVEEAISKLGLLYDKTYAWDIFSDMMVRMTCKVLLI